MADMTAKCKIAVVIGIKAPLRLTLVQWLAGFGIDSLHVNSERDGLALSESVEPDLIIVAESTNIGGKLGPRLMICANGGDAELMSAAVAQGADECLVAPFDADILKFKLEQTGVLAV